MKITSRFTRVAIATGLIVATGATVLGITGFASAKLNPAEKAAVVRVVDTTNPASAQSTADTDMETNDDQADKESNDQADKESNDDHRGPKVSPVDTAATALGMTQEQLITELKAGKSISQIAAAKNIDLASIKATLIAALKAHLDAEVASGKHTQAEADAKLAEASTRFDTLVTTPGLPPRREDKGPMGAEGRGRHGEGGRGRFVTPALATTLKLTTDEIHAQLKSGKSLAAIATAQNVSLAAVKATLTAEFSAHLAEEVTSGEHTQAEADAKKAEFASRLDDMINRVHGAGMEHDNSEMN